MSTEVKVPAAGESITSANVARWHKGHGDSVKSGDVLVTLETDKVSTDLEADCDGTLEIVVEEGEEVSIGTVIARIEEGGEDSATEAQESAEEEADEEEESAEEEKEPAEDDEEPAEEEQEPATDKKESGKEEAIEIKVPASGESITSANVSSWRKGNGDSVVEGEVLVLLETDKVSNEIEAPADGRLEILVPEGEEVSIGTVIARIEPGEVSARKSKPKEDKESKPQEKKESKPKADNDSKPKEEKDSKPQPSKPDFTLEPDRSEREQPGATKEGRTTRRKMSMLRRKIATHLVNAQQTAAILTTFNEVDMSAVMKLRKEVQDEFVKKHGVKLGFMSFFIKAVTQALKDLPSINARIEGNDVIENHFYDIGVAIGTDKGLFVPVIRDADQKSFAQIEKDILDYATKARDGKITIEDLQGGVFSISNGGTYGSLLSTPILNPPQSGILGMHTIQQRPVAVDGQVVIRPMMYLALSYDHRLVDGKEAVTFLIRIKESLESPARLLLEM